MTWPTTQVRLFQRGWHTCHLHVVLTVAFYKHDLFTVLLGNHQRDGQCPGLSPEIILLISCSWPPLWLFHITLSYHGALETVTYPSWWFLVASLWMELSFENSFLHAVFSLLSCSLAVGYLGYIGSKIGSQMANNKGIQKYQIWIL